MKKQGLVIFAIIAVCVIAVCILGNNDEKTSTAQLNKMTYEVQLNADTKYTDWQGWFTGFLIYLGGDADSIDEYETENGYKDFEDFYADAKQRVRNMQAAVDRYANGHSETISHLVDMPESTLSLNYFYTFFGMIDEYVDPAFDKKLGGCGSLAAYMYATGNEIEYQNIQDCWMETNEKIMDSFKLPTVVEKSFLYRTAAESFFEKWYGTTEYHYERPYDLTKGIEISAYMLPSFISDAQIEEWSLNNYDVNLYEFSVNTEFGKEFFYFPIDTYYERGCKYIFGYKDLTWVVLGEMDGEDCIVYDLVSQQEQSGSNKGSQESSAGATAKDTDEYVLSICSGCGEIMFLRKGELYCDDCKAVYNNENLNENLNESANENIEENNEIVDIETVYNEALMAVEEYFTCCGNGSYIPRAGRSNDEAEAKYTCAEELLIQCGEYKEASYWLECIRSVENICVAAYEANMMVTNGNEGRYYPVLSGFSVEASDDVITIIDDCLHIGEGINLQMSYSIDQNSFSATISHVYNDHMRDNDGLAVRLVVSLFTNIYEDDELWRALIESFSDDESGKNVTLSWGDFQIAVATSGKYIYDRTIQITASRLVQ